MSLWDAALKRGAPLPGSFVHVSDSIGIGKFIDAVGSQAKVELFHAVGQREVVESPLADLRRATLLPQTRVYARTASGRWRMGRVASPAQGAEGHLEYDVTFPNGQVQYLAEAALAVRCLSRAPDPVEAFAAGAMDTQYFHDRRVALQAELLRLRAASRGLTGLTSANVNLVRHQVGAIRRVLEDGLQRYLLADEVGMGKTIEAGAVIRQCLLDDPRNTVGVFVPSSLVGQWTSELEGRFGIGEFPSRVSVAPHEALLGDEGLGPFELAVVDEIHNLVADGDEEFGWLSARVRGAPRLLLLSATPALGDERTMLRILHLLAPEGYPLDRRAEFAARLARRQDYGRALLGLRPGLSGLMARRAIGQLTALFGDDAKVSDLVATIRERDAVGDQAAVDAAINLVKAHVADTYRIYRRLIRNRRKTTQGWEFPPDVRKSSRPWLIEEADEDARLPLMCDWLEQWRLASHGSWASLDGAAREGMVSRGSAIYARLFAALGEGADELAAAIDARRAELEDVDPLDHDEPGLLASAKAILSEEPGERGDATVIQDCLRSLRAQAPGRVPFKTVVFCTSPGRARRIASNLAAASEAGRIESICEGDDPEDIEAAVTRFREDPETTVLVSDRVGEEGQNLAFAQSVIHLDLPLSPARMEQRIGRLDRLGRVGGTIRQRVVLPPEDNPAGPYSAWLKLLVDGFGVFDGSISDVQGLLDRIEPDIIRTLYVDGAEGLAAMAPQLRERVAEERRHIEEQHALDELTASEDEDAGLLFEGMDDAEADESVFAEAVDGWLVGALGLRKRHVAAPPKAFKYEWHDRVLAPAWPWRRQFEGALGRPLTFSRDAAARHPGLCLLRPGAGPVDAVERFLRWDDRGAAFATWRYEPAWPGGVGEEWVGFRVCVVSEADLPEPDAIRDGADGTTAALRRRGDGLFPPTYRIVHLDAALRQVTEPHLLRILSRPYQAPRADAEGGRDYNLSSRQEALDLVMEERSRGDLCRAAAAAALAMLNADERRRDEASQATARAIRRLEAADERVRRRLVPEVGEGSDGSRKDLAAEVEASRLLAKAIAAPRMRVDAVGLFVIANYPPRGVDP